jgi:hypothetical protein
MTRSNRPSAPNRWRLVLVFGADDPRLREIHQSAELTRTGISDRIIELARAGLRHEEEFRTARLPKPRPGREVTLVGPCVDHVRVRFEVDRDQALATHLADWQERTQSPATNRLLRLLEIGMLAETADAESRSRDAPPTRDVPHWMGVAQTGDDQGRVERSQYESDTLVAQPDNPAADVHRAILAAVW